MILLLHARSGTPSFLSPDERHLLERHGKVPESPDETERHQGQSCQRDPDGYQGDE